MFAFLARLALGAVTMGGLALGALTLAPAPAQADPCTAFLPTPFPGAGLPNGNTITSCTTVLTITPSGTVTIQHNNTPYTNSGNSLIGVINDSNQPIYDLYVTGFYSSSPGIFQFTSASTGEVLCATSLKPSLACTGPTGDEGITSSGQLVYFAGISPLNGSPANFGDVIFTGDLAACQAPNPCPTAIFGTLQDVLTASVSPAPPPTPVPEPGSFAVFGTGLLGFALYRRRRRAALGA